VTCGDFGKTPDDASDAGDAGPGAADGAADAPAEGAGDAGGDAPLDGPCQTGLDCLRAGQPTCCCTGLCVAPSSCSGDLGGTRL
jgi:hypothetical protein